MVQTTKKRRNQQLQQLVPQPTAVLLAGGQFLLFLCYQFCRVYAHALHTERPASGSCTVKAQLETTLLPGCFCRGFGKFVTHVCGHMRILQGCREPSRKSCFVWDIWIPPSGVFGNVLAGTRARQYTPT